MKIETSSEEDSETAYDITIIPIRGDIFGKKPIKVKVILTRPSDEKLVHYPNILLVDSEKEKKIEKTKKLEETEKNQKREEDNNIWDILEKYREKDDSETIEDVSPEKKGYYCKNCQSYSTVIEDHNISTLVCSVCGIICGELIDEGPEWKKYNNDDNNSEGINRCGCPSNYFFPKSSQGTIVVGLKNNRLKRKQLWHSSMPYKEKRLFKDFEYISEVCEANGISKNIIDTAKILYKSIIDCRHKTGENAGKQIIIRRTNRLRIIVNCVEKACIMNKNPHTIKEISGYFNLSDKKITGGNKQFDKILRNIENKDIFLDQLNTNLAEDYITRFGTILKLDKKSIKLAVQISDNCCRMKLVSDHNPQSIAAGSILLMAEYLKLNLNRKDISRLFKTSDVTIGKIYKKISPYINALVNDKLVDHLVKKFKING